MEPEKARLNPVVIYGLQVTNVCQSGFISCSKGTIWWGMLTMVWGKGVLCLGRAVRRHT